jgi:rhamnosyltransferase
MVSVIIRNYNEEEYIGFAIQSVLDHIENPEIIIIDNKSSDDSLNIAKLFSNRCNIKIIKIEDYTPGKSINKGVKSASFKNILVLSAHAQITFLNLRQIENSLKSYVAVFGNQNPLYKGKKITKRYIWSHFKENTTIENMYSEIEDRYFLHNAFCFYNKEYLERNPFSEDLPGKEDRYWAKDIVERGDKYLYDSKNLICNHYYTKNGATWKGLG